MMDIQLFYCHAFDDLNLFLIDFELSFVDEFKRIATRIGTNT